MRDAFLDLCKLVGGALIAVGVVLLLTVFLAR
jgi:hypothetical protein